MCCSWNGATRSRTTASSRRCERCRMARNPGRYDHLIAFALDHPWAITPSMRAIVAGILAHRLAGEEPDQGAIAAALEARATQSVAGTDGAVALIPIGGVIAPRMNLFSDASGGTT